MCLTSGANDCAVCMSTVECNDKTDEENLRDYDDDDDDSSEEVESDFDYFSQFNWPEDDDNDDWEYFYEDSNDDLFVNNHLKHKQLKLVDQFEEKNYQRSKRSNKKINAQCQIKTKYAQSIKINSHNKHLYMHHRLFKQVKLDPPHRNLVSSVPLHPPEVLRSIVDENRHSQTKIRPSVPRPEPPIQFREYTINQHNIPNEPCFDDAMITFLLEMQNRDLSPEDYEMLLRLDERVQRKTVDTNILNTLPTILADETHINDQCTICMESYSLKQQLKLLPCKHMFHSDCIETYLKQFSTQCPLDNLPLI